jgi:SNF2 family DNA or RNA helicase
VAFRGGFSVVSALDRVDPQALAAAAERARTAHDVNLPVLNLWNSDPCEKHVPDGVPCVSCRRCGVILRRHQRVAISWFFLIRKGLLADVVGLGKTFSACGTIALAAQAGELDPRRGGGRVLVVCRPAALTQWRNELRRTIPGLTTEVIDGDRDQRSDLYAFPWDIAVVGHQMFLRDVEIIERLGIHHLVIDDVDCLRNCDNKTSWAVKRMATSASRVMLMTATPLQKKLLELYDLLDSIGLARMLFGPRDAFILRYLRRQKATIYTGRDQKTGKKKTRTVMEVVGYKHLGEFKELIAPRVLRRLPKDVDDIEMPLIIPNNVFLDLLPEQRARYDELQRGVLKVLGEGGELELGKAKAKWLAAAQICESLAVIDGRDSPGASVKFDWIVDKLLNDWAAEEEGDEDEKAVLFIHYRPGLEALCNRLDANGIGHVRYWGADRDRKRRSAATERFWDDPTCRALVGTCAIEQSLNLQCARHQVNVDQIPNPARMTQLAGRVRRAGSAYKTVYVHSLYASNTHEERKLRAMEVEAALASVIWSEDDPMYAKLSPAQMLQFISPDVGALSAA